MAFQAGKAEGKLELNTKPWTTGLTQSQSKLKSWVSNNKILFISMAAVAAAAFAGMIVGLKKVIKEAGAYEMTVRQLSAALKATGQDMFVSVGQLQDYASAIQRMTTISDGAALATMRLGISMGLSGEQIDTATKQAIGLSKAYNVDLNSAIKMVALAYQGEYAMLARYIPQIRGVTDENEKAIIINKALSDGWKIAQGETDTYVGKLAQLKNAWDDIMKKAGLQLIPFLQLFIQFVMMGIDKLDAWIGKFKTSDEAIIQFGENIKSVTILLVKMLMRIEMAVVKMRAFFLLLVGQAEAAKKVAASVDDVTKSYGDMMKAIKAIDVRSLLPKFAPEPEGIVGGLPTVSQTGGEEVMGDAWKYDPAGSGQKYKWQETQLPGGATRVEQVPINININNLAPSQLDDSQRRDVAKFLTEEIKSQAVGR